MAAEIGSSGVEPQVMPSTWHESVYGHVPTAEHFRTAEAAFEKFAGTHNTMRDTLLEVGTLEPDEAQEYAKRAARLGLGMREFCRNAGVDPDLATIDVLIGRNEKYLGVWQEATQLVQAEGVEPNVMTIKAKCRELWGKWQLTLDPEEHEMLAEARDLYEIALSEGHTDDSARHLVREIMTIGGKQTEKKYVTQTGHERTLDIMKYVGLKPRLENIVASSQEFEATCEQSVADSVRQLESEMAEVIELRSFFTVHGGETVDSPAEMTLKFDSIDEFRSHIVKEANEGRLSAGEFNRFIKLDSLDELLTYIQEHLAFECIDVMVAAAGILHRIPADAAAAEVDAREDRERYAAALIHAKAAFADHSIPATPNTLKRALSVAEKGLPHLPLSDAAPLAVALLANGNKWGEVDPDLRISQQ